MKALQEAYFPFVILTWREKYCPERSLRETREKYIVYLRMLVFSPVSMHTLLAETRDWIRSKEPDELVLLIHEYHSSY